MGQHGKPQNDQHRRWQEAPTTRVPVHRPGPLGALHDGQRRWHPVGRFLWWAFLLPLAIFAWSSWRLRGVVRVGGYLLAAWVLLVGIVAMTAPAAPPTSTASSVPAGQSVPVPTVTVTIPAPAPVEPAASPVALATPVPPAAPPTPVVQPLATPPVAVPTHALRPAAPRPSHPRPAPVVTPPAAGNAVGDTYTNVDGNQVQRPVAAASQPAGATATCKDGTWSFSQHHSGTCSGHGGVARFL